MKPSDNVKGKAPAPLPALTPEQRAAATERAAAARRERAEAKAALAAGEIGLEGLLARADGSPAVARARVRSVLTALPGVGAARAAAVMGRCGIAENRRIGGLGPRQRERLLADPAVRRAEGRR